MIAVFDELHKYPRWTQWIKGVYDERPRGISANDALSRLLELGGFPEPFLLNDEREAKRWRSERMMKLLREDIRDLSAVHELRLLDIYITALRERVYRMIVHANLAEDLQLSPPRRLLWRTV